MALSQGSRGQHRRNTLVQTLGNMALINKYLNPKLSNRSWIDPAASQEVDRAFGRRTVLKKYSVLKLNAEIGEQHHESRTDKAVRER